MTAINGNGSATIKNCYAFGTVNGPGVISGFVSVNTTTIENCVALNPDIILGRPEDIADIGRIFTSNSGTLTNNYARDDMKINGLAHAWQNKGLDAKDGEDVSAADYHSRYFWEELLGWDFTDIWEMGTVQTEEGPQTLPVLKGLPRP